MHTITLPCVDQILAEDIGRDGGNQNSSIPDVHVYRRIRLVRVPRPSCNTRAGGGIKRALVSGRCGATGDRSGAIAKIRRTRFEGNVERGGSSGRERGRQAHGEPVQAVVPNSSAYVGP